jgi:hypothetical protein
MASTAAVVTRLLKAGLFEHYQHTPADTLHALTATHNTAKAVLSSKATPPQVFSHAISLLSTQELQSIACWDVTPLSFNLASPLLFSIDSKDCQAWYPKPVAHITF